MSGPVIDLGTARLHVVTGKGGVGKSVVAGALALCLARGGRRVLLVELEGRQGIATLFDIEPLPYTEQHVATAAGGGEVIALAVDAEEALLDYLETFYNLRRAGAALRRIGAIDFATTVAPGLRDVLLTGKTCEAVRRRTEAGFDFDAVVLDAPPTGRITQVLNVNAEVAGLARVGPIRNQADSVMDVLTSPQTMVHLVTLLEEMPVVETAEAVVSLRAASLPTGAVIVNKVREDPLSTDDWARLAGVDPQAVATALLAARVVATPDGAHRFATSLLAEGGRAEQRAALAAQQRAAVGAIGLPVIELPLLTGGVELSGLYALARALAGQVLR